MFVLSNENPSLGRAQLVEHFLHEYVLRRAEYHDGLK